MTSTTLLLVRHGQTDWNLQRRYQGDNDIPLNATGLAQARQAALALKAEQVDGIISSHLSRAKQTADLIAEFHDNPVEVDERLGELNFGKWQGLTWTEIEAQYPDEARDWRTNKAESAPNGETFVELSVRTSAFLESMRGRGGRWIVAAHGGTIRSVVGGILGMTPGKEWQLKIQNVSIAEVELFEDATVLNRWNDTSHLERQGKIRPISLGIFLHQNHILVGELTNPVTGERYYRPLGGGIEFGETAAQALAREMREEIDATVTDIDYVATVENIFDNGHKQGHEIVQLCSARFEDADRYDLAQRIAVNDENNTAVWMPLDRFGSAESPPLYPVGLLEIVQTLCD